MNGPDTVETGKAWLAQQAEHLGAVQVEWYQGELEGLRDFDRNRWALRFTVNGKPRSCRFSEFDLSKILTDENVARASLRRLQAAAGETE